MLRLKPVFTSGILTTNRLAVPGSGLRIHRLVTSRTFEMAHHMEPLVDRLKKKYKAEVHPGFTAWIKSIQTAQIVNRDNEQGWQDGDGLIQIKQMKEEDLQHEVPVPESEHPYDEYLDVIKLPMEIPYHGDEPAPQFQFIRPDEYALFYCFGKQKKCILTGNPGISKSWFQWKFILLCYRQELLDRFVPFMEDEDDNYKEGEEEGKEGNGTEQVLKKRKMGSGAEKVLVVPSQKWQKANQNALQQSQPFIPNLIVRTISGTESYLFFVNGPTHDVLYIKHSPEDLKRFTDANSTILWEPGEGTAVVRYQDIDAHIIATVSPNQERFHEFQKRAKMFYMPCPSELQLRLMGQIYRSAAEEQYHHSDKEIHDRVIEFGPFIRNVLCWSEDELHRFKISRIAELEGIVSSDKSLAKALQSQVNIMESLKVPSGMSHRLARYVVHRDATNPFGGYTKPYYQLSCDHVQNEIIKYIAQSSIQFVKQQLIDTNKTEKTFELAHIYLEQIFEVYAKTGIQWKCCRMKLQSSLSSADDWQQYSVHFKVVDKSITAYNDMKHDVLYYPTDKSFPLVDMYYLDDERNLVGIQATMGEKHPKSVTTYEKFYEKLKTSPECTKLHLYYLILPRYVDKYYRENEVYPLSQFFWVGVKNGIDSKWKENINFYTLLPPDTFEASYPNNA